jgi:DNA repair exonuclease SbcCD nuclease subunit
MKIIHCADLHLDSKNNSNFDKNKAKERREELINTYLRMVDYAGKEGVSAILIAGDMFDTKNVSAFAKNAVLDSIKNNPEVSFYYLKGNHDYDSFVDSLDTLPDNLHLFNEEFTSYDLDESGLIKLYGAELSEESSGRVQSSFTPDPKNINIVMLHGQIAETGGKDKAEIINLRDFKNKGIDYLALGHIHEYVSEKLDGTGKYCYPGCLEGRGFDECGEHGFVLLDIDESAKTVTDTFIPFSYRNLYEVDVDITDAYSTTEVLERVEMALNKGKYEKKDLLKIVLSGQVSVDSERDLNYILKGVSDRFYFVKIKDESTIKVNYEDYRLDKSLKGEFVRLCEADASLTEEEKGEIIKLGIEVLSGGEIE